MGKKSEKILFWLCAVFILLLFISSGEKILPILEDSIFEQPLYKLSYPNSVIFNLSISYLAGVFIYYLTAYIPNQFRLKQQEIITYKLIIQVHSRINSLFRTILKGANEKEIDWSILTKDGFKEICGKCDLNIPTGAKKEISRTPFIMGDLLVRESLVNDWLFIINHLNEIDNASIYIDPEIYDLCLQIKKCSLSYAILELQPTKGLRNTNLEAWHSGFYDLNKLNEKLKRKLEIIKPNK